MNKFIWFSLFFLVSACKDINKEINYSKPNTPLPINQNVVSIVKKYIIEDSLREEKPVYELIVLESNKCKTTLVLTSTLHPESILESQPKDYFVIDTNLVLVYTQLEKLYETDTLRKENLEKLIRRKLAKYFPEVMRGMITYNPAVWIINLDKDSINVIKNPSEPYRSCDVQVEEIKFLPPEK